MIKLRDDDDDKPKMKRIIQDMTLTAIAAVKQPCQEGAVATILKSAPTDRNAAPNEFIRKVDEIQARQKCTRNQAYEQAAIAHPQALAAFRSGATAPLDFKKTVADEMAQGCAYSVAAQRAVAKGAKAPVNTDTWSRQASEKERERDASAENEDDSEKARAEFNDIVSRLQRQHGISRLEAFRQASETEPFLVARIRGR